METIMPRAWLNVFVDQSGVSPAAEWIKASSSVVTNGRTVRIWESNRSGSVIISDAARFAYGDAEVYLKLTLTDGTFTYLSAPVMTQLDVPNVQDLELNLLFLVGPAGANYRALVNGHCIYEVL
jgi:hypothetical protein